MNCNNCGSVLNCGCQVVKASNGTTCCTNCINRYEASLKIVKIVNPKN
jgi:hypothetical protein